MFLAALQLTNQGNLDLVASGSVDGGEPQLHPYPSAPTLALYPLPPTPYPNTLLSHPTPTPTPNPTPTPTQGDLQLSLELLDRHRRIDFTSEEAQQLLK